MKIIDAKEISKNTIEKVGEFYKDKSTTVIILSASDDKASEVYVDKKQKAFEEVGVNCLVYDLDEYTTTEDMIEEIQKFNEDDSITGIMVQHPVYKGIDFTKVICAIDPRKDIDGLHPFNQGMKNYGEHNVLPATALGVLKILDANDIDVKRKFVVIVGRGFLVADPLAKALEHRGATVVKIHTKTDVSDKVDLFQMADIIIPCAGTALSDWINPDECPNAEVLIGVGFRYIDGKQYQDFDMEDWKDVDGLMTNRINSTGLATISALLINSIICYKNVKEGK